MTEFGTVGTTLSFTTPSGDRCVATVDTAGVASAYGGHLRSREVRLAGDVPDDLLLFVSLGQGLTRAQRLVAYRQLDNEILSGLRLSRLAAATEGGSFPGLINQLVGYEPEGADEFVLLRTHQGAAIESYVGRLPSDDRLRLIDQLLLAVRWMSAAGLAHRGLSPSTARWTTDSRLEVTHLFTSTLIGSPREPVGSAPWAAPEQRASSEVQEFSGVVSDRDDVWAMARLAVTVINGVHTSDPADLDRLQLLDLFGDAFASPEQRPSPTELLRRRGLADPLRLAVVENESLRRGRRRFDRLTGYRQPEPPPDAMAAPGPGSFSGPAGAPETAARNGAAAGEGTVTGSTSPQDQARGWRWGRGGRR
jgi:hypothetical protein